MTPMPHSVLGGWVWSPGGGTSYSNGGFYFHTFPYHFFAPFTIRATHVRGAFWLRHLVTLILLNNFLKLRVTIMIGTERGLRGKWGERNWEEFVEGPNPS